MSQEIVKVCKVHGELTRKDVYFNDRAESYRGGYRRLACVEKRCNKCHNETQKRRYKKNPALFKLKIKKNREKNIGHYRAWARNNYKKNMETKPEIMRESWRRDAKKYKDKQKIYKSKYRRKAIDNLYDSYIRELIAKKISEPNAIDKNILKLAIFHQRDKIIFDRQFKQPTGGNYEGK